MNPFSVTDLLLKVIYPSDCNLKSILRSINVTFQNIYKQDLILCTDVPEPGIVILTVSDLWYTGFPEYVYDILVRLLWEYLTRTNTSGHNIELVIQRAVPLLRYTISGLLTYSVDGKHTTLKY